jgi:hypothetical protein
LIGCAQLPFWRKRRLSAIAIVGASNDRRLPMWKHAVAFARMHVSL